MHKVYYMKYRTYIGGYAMVDFVNPEYIRLGQMALDKAREAVDLFLVEDEEIIAAFKTVRDKVIFTNKRVIAINAQGITGKKVAYTSIPYAKIQTYAIETVGNFDLDSELDLWISTVGKIHFEISGKYDIRELNKVISNHIL